MSRIIKQINETLLGGRINRIYQISNYELLMTVRANRENHKLLISAHPMYARIQLTNLDFPTPQTPSHMTMLFRKHLEGGYLTKIEQVGLDRIARLEFTAFNELGDKVAFNLYIEIMGRHSNISLCDQNNKIIDCIKRISPSMNTTRFLQPGATYQLPPMQSKLDPFKEGYVESNNLTKTYSGFSPELSREVLYRLDHGETFEEVIGNINDSRSIYISKADGKEYFHVIPLRTVSDEHHEYSLTDGLDEHFGFIDEKERIKQQTANLERFVSSEYTKNETKLAKLKQELEDSKNADEYRIIGDLIYSSMHLIHKGMESAELDNYYTNEKIKVKLDPKLDARGNGQKYYNRYQKAKNAKAHLVEQIELTENEIEYFDSVKTLLANASYTDALEIKEELENLGYLKSKNRKKGKSKSKRPQFSTHFTKDGIEINIGKNNLQNDYLTFKYASRFDHWFHVKDIPGSHIIVRSDELDEYTIRLAANLAAYYSKARNSSSVPVNYCLVKNLKKPSGAKPGKVILSSYKTIYIDPDEQQVKEFENGKN